jgi:hypothetical protein
MSRAKQATACAVLTLALTGCAKKGPEPALASSADSPTYASEFPERLAAVKRIFNEQETDARNTTQQLSGFPEELDNPDWNQVLAIVELADREGRSQAYVERFEEIVAVGRFFKAEGEDVERKVGGSVHYAAKKKNCDADLGGTARVALRRSLVEQMEERLHDRSDAHALIEHNAVALGPKNVEKLRTQADSISRAAYAVHVGMVRARLELQAMLKELEQIRETLDRRSKDLGALANDPKLDDKQKKSVEEDLAATRDAKARLDGELLTARDLDKHAEQRTEQARQQYDAAIQKLRSDLQRKVATGRDG